MGGRSRLFLVGAVISTHPAYAQRTDNNAVTAAEDAFGKSVGDQSIGIYNSDDVRGFSPVDAGNLRIEGLYFDQAGRVNSRLEAGATIRVGISAQGHAFPAPTGIADYELRKPDGKLLTSIGLQYGPWRGATSEIDLKVPIVGDTLGIAGGISVEKEGSSFGTFGRATASSVTLRYAPRPGIEIIPFWSAQQLRSYEAQPIIYPTGDFLPKRAPRNIYTGQPWATYNGSEYNYGIVAKARAAGFDVHAGAFRSIDLLATNAYDLLFDAERDGSVAERYLLRDRGDATRSTSGEIRVSRSFVEGHRQHTLIASARYRDRVATYGGTDVVELGASRSDRPDFRPEPPIAIGPKTLDKVRQTHIGHRLSGQVAQRRRTDCRRSGKRDIERPSMIPRRSFRSRARRQRCSARRARFTSRRNSQAMQAIRAGLRTGQRHRQMPPTSTLWHRRCAPRRRMPGSAGRSAPA